MHDLAPFYANPVPTVYSEIKEGNVEVLRIAYVV